MAREDEKSIYFSLVMNYETVSTSRNQEEKNYMLDISENNDFVNNTFRLPANNVEQNRERSTKVLEDIESFIYIFFPYGEEMEVIARFIKNDGTEFSLRLNMATLITDSFKYVEITNKNTDKEASVKTIYS